MPETEPPRHSGKRAPQSDGVAPGRIRRLLPLAALSARTAGEALVVGVQSRPTTAQRANFHARTAERYTESLGQSKGALMKAGQLLSFISASRVIPPEFQSVYRAALARLRDDAPPMAPELARAVLERELNQPAESLFADFDWTALAAASIGQVHAARLRDGRAVAVKIQYPGVAAAIGADLKNGELLATFLTLLLGLFPKRMSVDIRGAAREISRRITEELDYRLEAASQAEFAAIYRGHPFIHVPEVIGELCTPRVLTQELAQGKPWREALLADQTLRDSWAEAIYRFIYASNHRFCLLHADPHPGNYVFHDDGSVSFLDFGCIKRFERDQVQMMNAIGRACFRGDVLGTWQASVEAGFWRSSDPVTAEEVFAYWREGWEIWWAEQPFTVTPAYVASSMERRLSLTGPAVNALRHLGGSPDYTIMERIELCGASLLAELRASNDWRSIASEFFEDAAPLTAMGRSDHAFFAERDARSEHA